MGGDSISRILSHSGGFQGAYQFSLTLLVVFCCSYEYASSISIRSSLLHATGILVPRRGFVGLWVVLKYSRGRGYITGLVQYGTSSGYELGTSSHRAHGSTVRYRTSQAQPRAGRLFLQYEYEQGRRGRGTSTCWWWSSCLLVVVVTTTSYSTVL